MKIFYIFSARLFLSVFSNFSAEALLLMTEILADPPAGVPADANGDGIISATDDELIEIFNPSLDAVDLSGWYLTDNIKTRHIFSSGFSLPGQGIVVVFGGGSPGLEINWVLASTGTLSLNNGGDTVTFFDHQNAEIDQVIYGSEGGHDQSLERFPQEKSGGFVLHSSLPGYENTTYSPGRLVAVNTGALVPEPTTVLLTGSGLLLLGLKGRRRKKNLST